MGSEWITIGVLLIALAIYVGLGYVAEALNRLARAIAHSADTEDE